MSTKGSDAAEPCVVDLPALCRHGQVVHGHWALARMARLAEGLCGPPGASDLVTWSARGSLQPVAGSEAQLWLDLHIRTRLLLQCQRCLQPMLQELALDRRLRFVRGEDEAARLDEDSEDDVLALPAQLDLSVLVEDELILALPLVPRHEQCSQPLPVVDRAADETGDEAPHPFAALEALRRRRTS